LPSTLGQRYPEINSIAHQWHPNIVVQSYTQKIDGPWIPNDVTDTEHNQDQILDAIVYISSSPLYLDDLAIITKRILLV
jgi:hypothetical protein